MGLFFPKYQIQVNLKWGKVNPNLYTNPTKLQDKLDNQPKLQIPRDPNFSGGHSITPPQQLHCVMNVTL